MFLTESTIKILVLLLAVSTVSIGCGSKVTIHPITDKDIYRVEGGSKIAATFDGWFLSDFYMEEIVKAKVDD